MNSNNNRGVFLRIATNIILRRLLAMGITALICIVLIWLILFSPQEGSQIAKKETADVIRPVTVILVESDTYQTNIEAYGEVVPEWEVSIKSKVQGEILEISDRFRKGNTLKKDDLLFAVEQIDYQVQLSEAKLGLQEAKTKLLVEEKEGHDALQSWKRSGLDTTKKPSSPLLLRKPYLEMAKANVTAAIERVSQAELVLEYTMVKAPFDALVVERYVSPGTTIFPGDEVGTLYGMKTFVIELHLGKGEWEKLSDNWQGMEVEVIEQSSGDKWTGRLMREGRLFESESRLRTLYVEVNEPLLQSPPLLPGNFVKVDIPGRIIPGLLRVPDSARTQKGLVWYVDSDNLLQSVEASPVFREKGYLYFKRQVEEVVSIVVNPNNSFVNGLKVTPIVKEN